MSARAVEAELLSRCAAVARMAEPGAADQREANVFQLAAMVVQSRFPSESDRLKQASERYFDAHPNDRLASVEVVRQGWVANLPRLRDMLTQQLRQH